ncbi:MAG TPA: GIY-YIG nuclease family protein [Acidobacteriaceae bacterium]
MRDRQPCVYIFSNIFRTLYIGVTSDLAQRTWHHKNGTYPNSFTSRYKLDHLVYFEYFPNMPAAIAREKQLKGWLRHKKLTLVLQTNPTWQDLSLEWGKPTEPYNPSLSPANQTPR